MPQKYTFWTQSTLSKPIVTDRAEELVLKKAEVKRPNRPLGHIKRKGESILKKASEKIQKEGTEPLNLQEDLRLKLKAIT